MASYNVENLFDLEKNGREYPEYVPSSTFGWNRETFEIKLTNIARVIKDLNADIILLQEIESRQSLENLQLKLLERGADYSFACFAGSRPTSVACAVLSRFPIIAQQELRVPRQASRNILQVTIEIEGQLLVIFNNHWNSKRHPESGRVACAKTLQKALAALPVGTDAVLAGDFNANYNEWRTIKKEPKLNDTGGITGINHILRTINGEGQLITENKFIAQPDTAFLYNLWLELKTKDRWSAKFRRKKNTLDNIIVSRALYDDRGISYVDNSFAVFRPPYLLRKGRPFRWQRAARGKGRHLGLGFSDHLPVCAQFSTGPFVAKKQ
ncbi:MAG: endonuclease [Deltaproteobacteria bacterium]|nr:endonuclease [Deltaproteobacteria bacterium]